MVSLSFLDVCVLAFLAIFVQSCGVQSAIVPCKDQDEFCSCPPNQAECEFILTIEELQTFTSYEIDDKDNELTRGTPGNVYYVNSSGYHPSPRPGTTRCGDANMNGLVNDHEFLERKCSVPMTVDGETFRLFVAVNGRIPGPTLVVDEGAIVRVTVWNNLTSEGITIHWHGMHQKGTPWMDGVGFISQAPITPGASFDYVFNATPAGTHWYHSHVGAQRTDGLFGALVVRERNFNSEIVPAILSKLTISFEDIIDRPEKHTMTLLDWQRQASLSLFVRIHSSLGFHPQDPIGEVPQSDYYSSTRGPDATEIGPIPYWSGLINGRGRYDVSRTISPLSIFAVAPSSAYRFRVVGAQSLYAYSFSIDSHKLHVIATDGHFIQPRTVDYLIVHSGERYDFVLEANQAMGIYWIRAETLEVNLQHSARAILKYGTSDMDTDFDWTDTSDYSSPAGCTDGRQCDVLNCPFKNYPDGQHRNCILLTSLCPFFSSPANSGTDTSTTNAMDTSPTDTPTDDTDVTDPPATTTATPATETASATSTLCPRYETGACTRFFNFGFEGINLTSAINGKNFKLPVTPYQTNCNQYENDRGDCNQCSQKNLRRCRCVHVESIMENERFDQNNVKTQIMVFSAVGMEDRREFAHPVHLHGHSFRVLHIGYGTYNTKNGLAEPSPDITCNKDELCRNPTWTGGRMPSDVVAAIRNMNTAILKDTVIVPAGGYVVVAFPADNPGYWFLHCHIEAHQLEGMGVLIEEYSYNYHRAPPEGINNVGHFSWKISDYKMSKEEYCKVGGGTCDAYWRATIFLGVLFGILLLFNILVVAPAAFVYKKKLDGTYTALNTKH